MPTTLSYPGVYIEEVPSGVRTIMGVPTSITAFIGRALKGPTDADGPVMINSYADFERTFGGLWEGSALGFAVRDFYLNGGTQALIVRLYREPEENTRPCKASIDAKGLALEAATPGAWGNKLRARIEMVAEEIATMVAQTLGVSSGDLFTLRLRDMHTGIEEQFRNVTLIESPRRVDRVLANESELMRVRSPLPSSPITPHTEPAEGMTEWEDNAASTGVDESQEASDGLPLDKDAFTGNGKEAAKEGLYTLEKADLFNLLCIPPYLEVSGIQNQDVDLPLISDVARYCETRRALLVVDPPSGWNNKKRATDGISSIGTNSKNAALFFPRLMEPNPLRESQVEYFAPCGTIAGIITRIDATHGVWKASAGLEASITGAVGLSVELTDAENGELNRLGVNCLRTIPGAGRVVWGARTLQGDDRLASEWKYLPVRRLALFLEESLFRGTQWVVFEPNDEPLWSQIRLNIGAFMQNLFRQGAFQGRSAREAYFVKCDRETTTQNDINQGIVNIAVGFAPLKPAEFVVIKLQQIAGQIQT